MTDVLTGLVSSETPLLDLWLAISLLCAHVVFPLSGASLCVQTSSLYKDTSQVELEPILTASFNLISSLRPYLQIQSHSEVLEGLELQHMNLGGHNSVHSNTVFYPNTHTL